MKDIKLIGTHSGKFHADDVVGTAILKTLYPAADVVRSRSPEVWLSCDVLLDVGNVYDSRLHRYDHHQASFDEGREFNGVFIPYASSGLIWKHFGELFIHKVSGVSLTGHECLKVMAELDARVIQYVDMLDVGLKVPGPFEPSVMGLISVLNPTYLEKNDDLALDTQFGVAVDIAKLFLSRHVLDIVAELKAEKSVAAGELLEGGKVLVLKGNYPWTKPVCLMPSVLYVVFPSSEGSWMVQCARDREDSFDNRKSMPSSWSGARDLELAKITGVPDAVFCHRGLFIAGAKSLEGAITLATLAVRD